MGVLLQQHLSKLYLIAGLFGAGIALSACQTLSKEECVAADWTVIGETDGAAGHAPQDRFARHVKACAKAGITPNQTAWNQGYQAGLVRYCTPANGLRVGEAGNIYANVCPLDKSAAFLSLLITIPDYVPVATEAIEGTSVTEIVAIGEHPEATSLASLMGDPVGPGGEPTPVPVGAPGRHGPPRLDQLLPPVEQRHVRIPLAVEPLEDLALDVSFGDRHARSSLVPARH